MYTEESIQLISVVKQHVIFVQTMSIHQSSRRRPPTPSNLLPTFLNLCRKSESVTIRDSHSRNATVRTAVALLCAVFSISLWLHQNRVDLERASLVPRPPLFFEVQAWEQS